MDDAISVFKTGSVIAFTGTSASIAIPTDMAGNAPRYIRVAANAACYVKLGVGSATAVAGDLLVQPADAVILAVNGATHIAAIQVSAGGNAQVSPLENL